ncbi:MAG: family 10 glycosylhydrolase [Rhodothermales bacterium]
MRHLRSLSLSVLLLSLAGLAGCSSTRPPALDLDGPAVVPPLPDVQREFRGAWVATVDNIDWPTRPGLSTAEQQAELRALLDRAVLLNLNAIVFQIRPTADAFYASPHEPWSAYLTGQQGQPPEPYYDPLAFAVEEAHRRGLELHAWFNPYRAYHPTAKGELAASHISRTHPEVVHQYGDLLWMDPSEPVVVDHSLRVILDVVARYDIDGVHLDDYFYPYPVTDSLDQTVPFPDSTSWMRAVAEGNTLSRDDWRRQSVDRFVERLYDEVKAAKPWVKVGISPFGIWRPGYPASVTGFDAYAAIYADARKWQQAGWVDYFTPQLYWSIDSKGQSYPALLDWWVEQNTQRRHLWPGNYISRVMFEGRSAWEPGEIVEQVRVTRARPGATGNVHFSIKALRDTVSVLGEQLAAEVYGAPALVPASPWLDADAPGAPTLAIERAADLLAVAMTPGDDEPVWLWTVRTRHGATWTVDVVPGWQQMHPLARGTNGEAPDEVAVSAVDRVGNEGPVARLRLNPTMP